MQRNSAVALWQGGKGKAARSFSVTSFKVFIVLVLSLPSQQFIPVKHCRLGHALSASTPDYENSLFHKEL